MVMAPSVETRVRVLRLLNSIAMLLRARESRSEVDIDPLLWAFLCEEALRMRVVSSEGLRSLIEVKCRGAKGDVVGVGAEVA